MKNKKTPTKSNSTTEARKKVLTFKKGNQLACNAGVFVRIARARILVSRSRVVGFSKS